MSAPRFGRLHKATAIVPLAVLSTAWTASLAGVGATTAVASGTPEPTLPDGTTVPTQAIEAPASVSLPDAVSPAVPKGQAGRTVRTASTSGIPSAALAAYQRAEAVINSADKSCNLSWQLIAAIGRVESDHGRYGGNVLDRDGVATPGIFGIALDGRNNTQRITDTDAGQYDNDAKFDRAVGPMQFIPSTWSVVGVDGDNDGKRNPQDIDDAALATAVYLCSGDDDLSSDKGQRAAVYRYNHSNDYVDLVLSIMENYLEGDFLAVPTGTTSAGVFTPDPAVPQTPKARPKPKPDPKPEPTPDGNDTGGNTGDGGDGGNNETPPPAPPPPPPAPPENDDDGPVINLPGDDPKDEDPIPEPDKVVEDTLTRAEATAQCLAQMGADTVASLNPLELLELEECVSALLKG